MAANPENMTVIRRYLTENPALRPVIRRYGWTRWDRKTGYSPLNAENSWSITHGFMFVYAHEKINILFSVMSLLFSFKNHLTIHKQNLAFPHVILARPEPQRCETQWIMSQLSYPLGYGGPQSLKGIGNRTLNCKIKPMRTDAMNLSQRLLQTLALSYFFT